ncbi:hypothetical protein SAMN05192570_2756 [Brevundimonas viscosa]|uniref:Uncharacterized protein n=2 Tax=Brevundimonas viscosa TaxID=871741 RepID=A0A1I6SWY6_9CAUL|nr:hypothetical protein SAMN05192570_2756 [Brevundimonas viscosa]
MRYGDDGAQTFAMDRRLFLQAYVAADGYPQTLQSAESLIRRIGSVAAVRECRVRPYNKFEDQYGVWLDLDAARPAAAFEALLADLAQGWRAEGEGGERFAVWDGRLHGAAFLPALRWLHLNLHPAADD